jgi:2,4-dienoyl-CoA reductase-like NADH-dependent reductase (Old Yellow Enzyme family)/thioredoxin reductase
MAATSPDQGLLFSRFSVGGIELDNRLVMAPMGTGLPAHDGRVNDETVAYYRRRAEGGVGLVTVEASLVSPGSSAIGPELRLHDDEFVPGLARLVAAVHDAGVPVGIQLWHPGRQTIMGEPVAPSAIPLSPRTRMPHALEREEIHALVRQHAEAAARCRTAGFDFVEIHAAHCYLPCEFLSPLCNARTDEYGGDLRSRARFLLEIVEAIRLQCGPDFPVFCRVSGEEGSEGGFEVGDIVEVSRWLEEAGVACISVSAGNWYALHLTIPPMSMERGCLVPLAARIKEAVGIPVMAAGRLDDPELAESVLEQGQADLIALGRALIADPDWAAKVRDGRVRDVRPCISCNACVDLIARGERARCAVNPEVSREGSWRVVPAEQARRVMVIGGGIAGMEAARVARLRGHSVSLWEQDDELGGKLDVASRAPSKHEVLRFREYQARLVDELGVVVHVGAPVTREIVEREDPDLVVVATGALPLVPPIPGIDGPTVVDAQDILLDNVQVASGERVAVVGGSATGCETAEYLLGTASELIILEMRGKVGTGIELITRQRLLRTLRGHGVAIRTGWKVVAIDPSGVTCELDDGTVETLSVGRVALAIGWRPTGDAVASLAGGREVVVVGDALDARDFVAAVASGADAGLAA